jgi:hypothetical protein
MPLELSSDSEAFLGETVSRGFFRFGPRRFKLSGLAS